MGKTETAFLKNHDLAPLAGGGVRYELRPAKRPDGSVA